VTLIAPFLSFQPVGVFEMATGDGAKLEQIKSIYNNAVRPRLNIEAWRLEVGFPGQVYLINMVVLKKREF